MCLVFNTIVMLNKTSHSLYIIKDITYNYTPFTVIFTLYAMYIHSYDLYWCKEVFIRTQYDLCFIQLFTGSSIALLATHGQLEYIYMYTHTHLLLYKIGDIFQVHLKEWLFTHWTGLLNTV